MSLEFMSTLSEILGKQSTDRWKTQLQQYAAVMTPLIRTIPIAGMATDSIRSGLKLITQQDPWHRQFQKLSEVIEEIGKPVLIIIDDVDRLNGTELLNLLRIVRLLGRFRGVHYLLAYDDQTIEDLLRSTGTVGRATSFMEKIVQYPFELPPIPEATTLRLINHTFNELISITIIESDELSRFRATQLVNILSSQIHTPRTLKRFREHLLTFLPHVLQAELDLWDYVAVTWLRLNSNELWRKVPSWYRELITGESRSTLGEAKKLSDTDWNSRIERRVGETQVAENIETLSFLFPGISRPTGNNFYHHSHALADREYFGRYLLLGIPEGDVNDAEIRKGLSDAELGKDTPHVQMLKQSLLGQDSLANLVINKVTRFRRGAPTTSLKLIEFLSTQSTQKDSSSRVIGDPKGGLESLLAREIACGISTRKLDVESVVDVIGEDQLRRTTWAATALLEFRSEQTELRASFARYWSQQLPQRADEFRENEILGEVAGFIAEFSQDRDAVGILDPVVSSYDTYIETAMAFATFLEWMASDTISYQLDFNSHSFNTLISESVHQEYRKTLEEENSTSSSTLELDLDRLPSKEIDPEILRAFVIRSILLDP